MTSSMSSWATPPPLRPLQGRSPFPAGTIRCPFGHTVGPIPPADLGRCCGTSASLSEETRWQPRTSCPAYRSKPGSNPAPLPSLTWAFAQVSCLRRLVPLLRADRGGGPLRAVRGVRFQNESPAQSDAGLDAYDDRVRSISRRPSLQDRHRPDAPRLPATDPHPGGQATAGNHHRPRRPPQSPGGLRRPDGVPPRLHPRHRVGSSTIPTEIRLAATQYLAAVPGKGRYPVGDSGDLSAVDVWAGQAGQRSAAGGRAEWALAKGAR
jgi:hypothetical protein